MQYTILNAYDAESLAVKVRNRIQEGWEPQGGVTAALNNASIVYAQAMIKKAASNGIDK